MKPSTFAIPPPATNRRGVALVIILAFIVLLSGLVVAFFSRAMSERQVANSSANRAKAEMFARGAADQITGDLKQEIAYGSTSTTVGTTTIYTPKAATYMVPQRVGSSGSSGLENLVKISKSSLPSFSDSNGSTPVRASSALTSDVSINGRSITAARWNKPMFMPVTSGSDYTPLSTTGFASPAWILMARDGSNPTSWSSNMIYSKPSDKSVLGRYAYAIYDEGGLLDANVAGYPTNVTGYPAAGRIDYSAYKGNLAFADITRIGSFLGGGLTSTPANKLIAFRNYASAKITNPTFDTSSGLWDATSRANYDTFVLSNRNGFLTANSTLVNKAGGNTNTDRMFTSRQQLIRFVAKNLTPSTQPANYLNSMNYLTHFSRELNAPSWGPATPSGSSIDYAANANSASAANRLIPNVLVQASFTRADGTQAQAGEPLIKSRFPLLRLGGLGYSGVVTTGNTTMLNGALSPASAATIQRDFGLAWDNTNQCWNYAGSAGSTLQSAIKNLNQVASENREPNFFELLKAGILSGSLGVDGGGKNPTLHEADADLQILQIGANLIDQFDADSYPSRIRIDRAGLAWEAVGIEHLPYIAQYKPIAGKSPDGVDAKGNSLVATYFLFNLWNPHRVTAALPLPTTNRPDIRLSIEGSLNLRIAKTGADGDESGVLSQQVIPVSTVPLTTAARDGFQNPGILTASGAGLSSPGTGGMQWVTAPAGLGSYAAYRITDCDPTFFYAPRTPSPYNKRSQVTLALKYSADDLNRFEVKLEYKDPSGAWRAYNYAHGINDASQTWRISHESWVANGEPDTSTNPYSPRNFDYVKSLTPPKDPLDLGHTQVSVDPRTRRFASTLFGGGAFPGLFQGSLWPTSQSSGYGSGTQAQMQLLATKIWPSGSSAYPALLSRNNSAASQYKDADNVTRLADSGYFTGDNTSGNPFSYDSDRPIILNRPFQSVAEMGFASRDLPFRSLDFFTDKSPDAALLDLFSVNELMTTMRAGVVNLNTRQTTVLQAVLAGTTTDFSSNSTLSNGNASTIANAILAKTATAPFQNPSELANVIGTLTVPGNRKTDRETATRALGGVGQTRTWNLMVDVIAQTGRYPQSAANLNNFLVEGESRYWVHLAIDRFTGQVIDSQLELVREK